METQEFKTSLDYALAYEKLGWSIIPVGPNKRPLLSSWEPFQTERATPQKITNWYTQWPNAGIAVITGKISNLVALDFDVKHNRSSKEFIEKGLIISPTVTAQSGGNGEHFFFDYSTGQITKNSQGQIFGPGIDVKTDGGYIVLSPSLHESGNRYKWVYSPWDIDLASIPQWLTSAYSKHEKDKTDWDSKISSVAPEGTRNQTATEIIGKLLHDMSPELWDSAAWDAVMAWNQRNIKPLDQKELRASFDSIKKKEFSRRNSKEEKAKDIVVKLLEEICNREDVTLFHDEQNEAYISLDVLGYQQTWPCKSKAMKRMLSNKVWRSAQKPLSSESIKNILGVLEGKAYFEGPKIKLHNRVAWHNGELWYDLTNDKWQAIKITTDGWELVEKPPIIFKRYSHHSPQVMPDKNGDVKLFLKYINVNDPKHQLLLLVFLVSCFIPDFPHVLLVIFGPQGSAKSTLSKFLRIIIDPSIIEAAGLPDNQKELIQILAHHYFLFFDNLSYISEITSDILCKAITGSGFSKRELYENDDDIIYNFMRCIGMNGVNLVATRPDLLERCMLVELQRIEENQRKQDMEIRESFQKDLPLILGGVFDVVVKALKIKPTIKVSSLPRMADYAVWGCAIAEALGYTKEDFLEAYAININHQTEMLLNENTISSSLISFMTDKDEWRGTATDLLDKLTNAASWMNIDTHERYWPKGPAPLSRRLNELSTNLKKIGIEVIINTTGLERYIEIRKISKNNDSTRTEPIPSIEPDQSSIFDTTDTTDGISPGL